MAGLHKIEQTHLHCRCCTVAVISFVTFLDSPDTPLNVTPFLKREKCDFQIRRSCLKSIICACLFHFKELKLIFIFKKRVPLPPFPPLKIFILCLQIFAVEGISKFLDFLCNNWIIHQYSVVRIDVNHFSLVWLMFSKVPTFITFILCRFIDEIWNSSKICFLFLFLFSSWKGTGSDIKFIWKVFSYLFFL